MCEAVLKNGATVRFHARGLSMQPNINDGEAVELRPATAQEVSKGEIVLAQTGDGLRLHRVVEKIASGVLTRGDAEAIHAYLVDQAWQLKQSPPGTGSTNASHP